MLIGTVTENLRAVEENVRNTFLTVQSIHDQLVAVVSGIKDELEKFNVQEIQVCNRS